MLTSPTLHEPHSFFLLVTAPQPLMCVSMLSSQWLDPNQLPHTQKTTDLSSRFLSAQNPQRLIQKMMCKTPEILRTMAVSLKALPLIDHPVLLASNPKDLVNALCPAPNPWVTSNQVPVAVQIPVDEVHLVAMVALAAPVAQAVQAVQAVQEGMAVPVVPGALEVLEVPEVLEGPVGNPILEMMDMDEELVDLPTLQVAPLVTGSRNQLQEDSPPQIPTSNGSLRFPALLVALNG